MVTQKFLMILFEYLDPVFHEITLQFFNYMNQNIPFSALSSLSDISSTYNLKRPTPTQVKKKKETLVEITRRKPLVECQVLWYSLGTKQWWSLNLSSLYLFYPSVK